MCQTDVRSKKKEKKNEHRVLESQTPSASPFPRAKEKAYKLVNDWQAYDTNRSEAFPIDTYASNRFRLGAFQVFVTSQNFDTFELYLHRSIETKREREREICHER